MKIKDLMTQDVQTIGPEASLKEAAALLAERGISGVPVVDGARRVLGVLSEADILAKERGQLPERKGLFGLLHSRELVDLESKLDARSVADAMTAPALTIRPKDPLSKAAALMADKGIKRLPVVEDGTLVGIVTRADLVRAFIRTDEEIEREIREDVIMHTLWITPEELTINVEGGVVTIAGEVEMRSDAELLPEFIRRVVGVVHVEPRLTYRADGSRFGTRQTV